MEQQFVLKQYGNMSLFEVTNMTGEERAWWIARLDKEYKKQGAAKAEQQPKFGPGIRQ